MATLPSYVQIGDCHDESIDEHEDKTCKLCLILSSLNIVYTDIYFVCLFRKMLWSMQAGSSSL